MNSRPSVWSRLVEAARLAPADARDASAPAGFSTRVAARALAAVEPSFAAVMARLSWRGLAVAALVMLASVAAGYQPVRASLESEASTALNDPVGEMLNLS